MTTFRTKLDLKTRVILFYSIQYSTHRRIAYRRSPNINRVSYLQVIMDIRHIGPMFQGPLEGDFCFHSPPLRTQHTAKIAVCWK